MKIWVHRYTLQPRKQLSAVARPGPREGALLRVGSGFADLHPWPELGDPPLGQQLAMLAKGETTPQAWASLRLARCDGQARERGVSAFDGVAIPESHWPGADPPSGFRIAKLKGIDQIPMRGKLRIDFNATLTPGEFLAIARSLPADRVDFIEDPCPYEPRLWKALHAETGLRLALDRGVVAAPEANVVIHKPALQAEWPEFDGDVVVTSYMDHPIGQYGAALVAATRRVQIPCGLFTHVLFEPDPFIEAVRTEGARLLPAEGTGLGFDELLERLPWKRLS